MSRADRFLEGMARIVRDARIKQWREAYLGQYAGHFQDEELMVRAARHAIRTYYRRLGLPLILRVVASPRVAGDYIWERMDTVDMDPDPNFDSLFPAIVKEYTAFGWQDRYDQFGTSSHIFGRVRRELEQTLHVDYHILDDINGQAAVASAELVEALYFRTCHELIHTELKETLRRRSIDERILAGFWDWFKLKTPTRSETGAFLAHNPLAQVIMADIVQHAEDGDTEYQPWHLAGNALIDAVGHGLGFLIPTRRVTLLIPAPRLYFNVQGELHRETGPAIEWRDGTGGYFRSHVHIPGWIIEEPDRINLDTILDEQNAEIRRVMLDRFGREQFLKAVDAHPVNTSKTWGTLWRYRNPRHFPWRDEQMVEVVCPTTGEHHFLEVPMDDIQTAHQAVAWTFEQTPQTYGPLIQT